MEPSIYKHTESSEFDLRQIMHILLMERRIVIICTLVVSALVTAYAFFSKPVYETSAQTLPPTISDLSSYNSANQLTGDAVSAIIYSDIESAQDKGIEEINPEEAYDVFIKHLTSDTVRQSFFNNYYLLAHKTKSDKLGTGELRKILDKNLRITTPIKKGELTSTISLQGDDPEVIAQLANNYLRVAMEAARQELVDDLAGQVRLRMKGVGDQISVLRKVAIAIRQEQITRIHNALVIAESIGLETPPQGSPLIAIGGKESGKIFSDGSLTYLRGAKALRSELEQLKTRIDDDAYIPELSILLKRRALLQNIELAPQHLAAATIDRLANVAEEPTKPKKLFLITLGIIFGGMCGLFLALICHVFRRRQDSCGDSK